MQSVLAGKPSGFGLTLADGLTKALGTHMGVRILPVSVCPISIPIMKSSSVALGRGATGEC